MHKFWASLGYKMVPCLRERRGKDREGVGGEEEQKGGEGAKRKGKEKRGEKEVEKVPPPFSKQVSTTSQVLVK